MSNIIEFVKHFSAATSVICIVVTIAGGVGIEIKSKKSNQRNMMLGMIIAFCGVVLAVNEILVKNLVEVPQIVECEYDTAVSILTNWQCILKTKVQI